MIQRIQSIFLLLSSIGFFSLFSLPFAVSDTGIPQLLADRMYNILDHVVLIILAVAGGLLGLTAIFLFKNRELQIKLSYFLIIVTLLLPLVAFLLIYNEGTAMIEGAVIDDGAGIYVAGINIVFAFLASYFIKKDQKLVESMDRLR
jgi:hypothetical protein